LSNVTETTALAFWVPLGEGDAVSGIKWFNNDGDVVFPAFLAVAGEAGHPELLAEATPVAYQVSGASLQWCDFTFDQPIGASSSGLYLIWKLPTGSFFTDSGTGGGAGFGVTAGDGENRCWVTSDGSEWEALTASHQVAMSAVMGMNKSSNILVLSQPGSSKPDQDNGQSKRNVKRPSLLSASPNPFNPLTTIRFRVPIDGIADVSIYDVRGRLVANLVHRPVAAGELQVDWNGQTSTGRSAPSGMYLVRMTCGEISESIGITLTK